jgi:hydrogenase expression/formation protein HypD
MVVTGFEPIDLLQGILMTVRQLEEGRAELENQYTRMVREEGNTRARQTIADVFEITDRSWRGLGEIPESGFQLRESYAAYDAARKFAVDIAEAPENPECISGAIMKGLAKPTDCPNFGTKCTPERPLGAPMVSSEGACAAYYNFRAVLEEVAA